MPDKPPKDEPGADERFKRWIANALKMPAKPHKPKREPVAHPQSKSATPSRKA